MPPNMDAAVTEKTGDRDKHQKFRELAENRTNKAIDAILRIGNLSNRQIYQFEDHEARKIIRALKDAIAMVEGRFQSPRGKAGGGFKL
jgi:hypothetical protein